MGAQLQRDVVVDFFTQRQSALYVPGVVPCETCTIAEEVMAELEPLIPRLKVRTHDMVGEQDLAQRHGVNRVPTLVFNDELAGRVTFVGAPLGYEFASFLSGVLEAGGAAAIASEGSRAKIASVPGPINLKVFVTPT